MRIRQMMLNAVASVLLAATTEAAGPPVAADSDAASAAGNSRVMQEVTVIAQRLKLEAKITNYVYGIAALQNREGVARWQEPVCPQVSGLTREAGEFVLERLSEIARDAAVPLAGESCRANLFIFVTYHPQELLQAMEKRYFAVAFGNATPSEVDAFVKTPRAVRVWHSPYWSPSGGTTLAQGVPPSAQVLGGGLSSPPVYNTPGAIGASRLMAPGSWRFGNVYVIADASRMRGVSQGQFADYIAMVSLAQIKPAAQLNDAKSILTLFGDTPQAAPAGMSDWDQAFLKSLYATAPETTMPRSLISRGMMRDLVP